MRDFADDAFKAVSKAIEQGVLPRLQRNRKPLGVKCTDCDAMAMQYDHRNYLEPLRVDPVCCRCNAYRGPAANRGIPRNRGGILVFRLPRDFKQRLEKEARKEQRSLSDYIRLILASRPEQGRDVP